MKKYFLVSTVGVFLSLASGPVARADYDFSMGPIAVNVLSLDLKPVESAVLKLYMTHYVYRFGLVGERPPLPGFDWFNERLFFSFYHTQSNGSLEIPAKAFSSKSSRKKDPAISLEYAGQLIPECKGGFNQFGLVMLPEDDENTNIVSPKFLTPENCSFYTDITPGVSVDNFPKQVSCTFSVSMDVITKKVEKERQRCLSRLRPR